MTEDVNPAKESHKKRIDRELMEMLGELRVTIPGVQVLFGFLLTIPFTQRFVTLSTWEKSAFFGAFFTAILSTGLLMAPATYHRIGFRDRTDKERMLFTSSKLAIAGCVALAVSVALSTFVLVSMTAGAHWGAIGAAVTTGILSSLWFVLPLSRRRSAPAPREQSEGTMRLSEA
jgi:hypothetical protein